VLPLREARVSPVAGGPATGHHSPMLAPMLASTLHAIDQLELGQDGDQSCTTRNGSVGGTLKTRGARTHGRGYSNKGIADRLVMSRNSRQPNRAHLYEDRLLQPRRASLFAMQQLRSASYRPLKGRANAP